VAQPLFKVSVAEIERNDVTVDCPIPPEWIDAQLAETEAKSQGKNGRLTAYLAKNGREILVQGKVSVDVVMPCARTLDPVPLTLQPDIYLLLTPKGSAAKMASAKMAPGAAGHPKGLSKDKGSPGKEGGKKGKEGAKTGPPGRGARHARAAEEDDSGDLLSEQDAARDTFDGEHVVLDDFLREHLVLELPLFPLRSDLRSEDSPAIRPPTAAPAGERPVDPRLAPLAAIADKMRQKKE
jgi:uncharacterized protein